MTVLPSLAQILVRIGPAAIAVSGGVDSLTLATISGRRLGPAVTMHHATSPAVPAEATRRVEALAAAEGWTLDIFDAGEFADAAYRANPVNRCFFCKTNLYGAVAGRTSKIILSGTNLDDLGEYRPGLQAARDHGVRHPFVEAGIGKAKIRALARTLGLGDVAELPSAPCLSSRIETGIRIEAHVLAMVHAAETLLRQKLSPKSVRCRVRAAGVVIELDQDTLDRLAAHDRWQLGVQVGALASGAGLGGAVMFAPYRAGSAFVGVPA